MAQPQRLRLYYLLGWCHSLRADLRDMLAAFDHARGIASELHDWISFAELAAEAGNAHLGAFRFVDAVTEQRLCLGTIRAVADNKPARSRLALIELRALVTLASATFMLGRYTESSRHIVEASDVLSAWGPDERTAANLAWMRALHLRWQGKIELALVLAHEAAARYERLGQSAACGRSQGVVAGVMLDLADTFPFTAADGPRSHYAMVARTIAERALVIAQKETDRAGEGMALLTIARSMRVGQPSHAGLGRAVEAVLRLARQISDRSLAGQAFTELGYVSLASGLAAHARACFRHALADLTFAGCVALDVWANRGLHACDEVYPDA